MSNPPQSPLPAIPDASHVVRQGSRPSAPPSIPLPKINTAPRTSLGAGTPTLGGQSPNSAGNTSNGGNGNGNNVENGTFVTGDAPMSAFPQTLADTSADTSADSGQGVPTHGAETAAFKLAQLDRFSELQGSTATIASVNLPYEQFLDTPASNKASTSSPLADDADNNADDSPPTSAGGHTAASREGSASTHNALGASSTTLDQEDGRNSGKATSTATRATTTTTTATTTTTTTTTTTAAQMASKQLNLQPSNTVSSSESSLEQPSSIGPGSSRGTKSVNQSLPSSQHGTHGMSAITSSAHPHSSSGFPESESSTAGDDIASPLMNNGAGTNSSSNTGQHNSMIGVRNSYLSGGLISGQGVAEPAPTMHWFKLPANGTEVPPALRAQSTVLVGRDRLFVFGGCDETICYADLWVYDIEAMWWSKPKCSGNLPPPCRAHSASLLNDRWMIVFGGGDGPDYYNTVYILDIETLVWYKPAIRGTPPGPRRAHTAWVYNGDLYIYAGGDGSKALADLFILNTSKVNMEAVCTASISSQHISSTSAAANVLTWTELEPSGAVPTPRGYHTTTLVGESDYLILFGGSDGHECFSDVHILDLKNLEWKLIPTTLSFPRLSHTAVQVGSYIFVIGGHNGSEYGMDMILLNLVSLSWETRRVHSGKSMDPRGYQTANLADSRIWIYGGYNGGKVFGDMWILELGSCSYLPQITSFEIAIDRAEA